ncbi:hypothetical protein NG895_08125 [Aeoliella sp. ICT_H6.2]|uniref:Uncharacterized protein n=1 Tax=Aeoliella straminimaris TaxID=2954799 RepID=A0A9X2JGS2_9BACT|nr:hypothetical protein [Aeoliella straminimaris]MCO6043873.1 hypothetical protein [Aeoliella straminimaris]
MSLYYSSSSRHSELGKFRRQRRPGMQHDGQRRFGNYRFELISMETSAPFKRTRYHLRIINDRNLRVAYLRDFPNQRLAFSAGEEWVAERELAIQEKKNS